VRAAAFTTVPARRLGHSAEMHELREATLRLAVKAASAQAPSAATIMAARRGASRRVEAPVSVALVAAEVSTVAADITNRTFVIFRFDFEI
jgi:hypothetical protein